jgi:hypothetical protein
MDHSMELLILLDSICKKIPKHSKEICIKLQWHKLSILVFLTILSQIWLLKEEFKNHSWLKLWVKTILIIQYQLEVLELLDQSLLSLSPHLQLFQMQKFLISQNKEKRNVKKEHRIFLKDQNTNLLLGIWQICLNKKN